MSRKLVALQVVAVALTVVAAVISYDLLGEHIGGRAGSRLIAASCGDDTGGGDCSAVVAGDYGYLPPKRPDEPAGMVHLPAAFLGMVYYSLLGVWLVGVGPPSRGRRWLHLIPLAFMTVGMASSVYFIYIMKWVVEAWCQWCLVTHACNLLVFIAVILMWPRKKTGHLPVAQTSVTPDGGNVETPVSASAARVAVAPHPSLRILFMTFITGFAILFAEVELVNYKLVARERDLYVAEIQRISGNPRELFEKWQVAEPIGISLRDDEPERSVPHANPRSTGLPAVCVIVSDFQCPHCKRLADFLEDQVQPLFAGHLKIVFKHFPLDRSCNRYVSKTLHKHACRVAIMAEAARLVGGSEAFWKAHDYLFAHQKELGKITPAVLAEAIGISADDLTEQMESEIAQARVKEDIDLARRIKVSGTPRVYIADRPIDRLARRNIRFWDLVAGEWWKQSDEPRPASTTLAALQAIRDNRGPKDAR
ncbi:MAG: vitamin K epoxide reductase family protein [Planctomycetes bacterium]|nr:vitamin K epoxide reductase family protein [Planctomycetota bacterium]